MSTCTLLSWLRREDKSPPSQAVELCVSPESLLLPVFKSVTRYTDGARSADVCFVNFDRFPGQPTPPPVPPLSMPSSPLTPLSPVGTDPVPIEAPTTPIAPSLHSSDEAEATEVKAEDEDEDEVIKAEDQAEDEPEIGNGLLYTTAQETWILANIAGAHRVRGRKDWRLCSTEFQQRFQQARKPCALRQKWRSMTRKRPPPSLYPPEEEAWLVAYVSQQIEIRGRKNWVAAAKAHSEVFDWRRSAAMLCRKWKFLDAGV